jgi:hypothetical protein
MPFQPTPPQLFEDFEAGRITRKQLHAGLEWHARELVEEVVEAHEDPRGTWWEGMLAKRAAARLANRHGLWRVRHVLAALSRIPEFEPARYLWNALHPDVPLHAFFRMRRRPVLRLLKIENRHGNLHATVEYDDSEGERRLETYLLCHGTRGLEADPRPLDR